MNPSKTHFHNLYSKKDYKFTHKPDQELIQEILEQKQSGSVLDLGCGEGGNSLALAEKGFNVTCIDISETAINKIKQESEKRKLNITTITADLEDYKIERNYDIILAMGILQFFGESGGNYIEKLQRHTKKEGLNIIDAFVNKWLPKDKLKESYDGWSILDYEEYKQKTISGGKKWMNYVLAKKPLGGWQCWVEMKKDHVIKTFKTKKEIKETVKRYLDSIGKPEELEDRANKMLRDIADSTKIIQSSKIPKKLLAFPIFLKSGKVKQKRVIVLDEKFNELLFKGKKEQINKIVDKSIDFMILLWKYEIHEKTFKFYSNFGLLGNEIVLIDLFELTNKKEKVEKQIKNKGWKHLERLKQHFAPEIIEYFLEQVEKRLTVKKLNEVWGINLK